MKTMTNMLSMGMSDARSGVEREPGEKLPDGERYFGFVNVSLAFILTTIGFKHLLCQLCDPGALSLQEIQKVSPLLQGAQAVLKGCIIDSRIRATRAL